MSSLGNKEIMSENIKRLMHAKGIDRNKLVDDLGLKYTTVSDWINGKTYPRIDKIEMMANYFNVEKADLVEKRPDNLIPVTKTVKIPIIGSIACGDPITAEQNIEGYRTEVADHIPDGNVFFLRCHGTSMEPTISDGAYVLIKVQPTVEDGEIAAVLVDDQSEATLKRVHHQGENIILAGDNPSFPPIMLNKDYPGRIIGKAIKVSFDL